VDEGDPLRELEAAARATALQRPRGPVIGPASWSMRVAAFVMDSLFMFIAVALFFLLLVVSQIDNDRIAVGLWLLSIPVLPCLYLMTQMTSGATPAMRIFGLRIVPAGTRSTLRSRFYRWLLVTAPLLCAVPMVLLGFLHTAFQPVGRIPSNQSYFLLIAVCLDLLFVPWWIVMSLIAIGTERQTLPDLWAETNLMGYGSPVPSVRGFEPVMRQPQDTKTRSG
jgi:hypothetical protein